MHIYEDKENKLPSATRVAASSHITQLAAKEKLKEATGGNGRSAGILRARGYNGTHFASTTGTATGTAPKRRAATVAYQFESTTASAKRPEWSRAQRVLRADRVDPSCLLPEKVSNERSSKPLGYADLLYDSPAAVHDIDNLRTSAARGKQVRVISPRDNSPQAAPNTSSATATTTKNVSDGDESGRQPQRDNFKHILEWKPRSSRGGGSSRKDDAESHVVPAATVSAATAVTVPKTAAPTAAAVTTTAGAHVTGRERAKQVKPAATAAVTAATSVSGKTSKLLWSGLDGLRVRRVPAGESTDEDDEDTEAQMPSRPTVRLGGHSDNLARGAALTRTPTAVRLSDPPERGFDMSLPDRDTTGPGPDAAAVVNRTRESVPALDTVPRSEEPVGLRGSACASPTGAIATPRQRASNPAGAPVGDSGFAARTANPRSAVVARGRSWEDGREQERARGITTASGARGGQTRKDRGGGGGRGRGGRDELAGAGAVVARSRGGGSSGGRGGGDELAWVGAAVARSKAAGSSEGRGGGEEAAGAGTVMERSKAAGSSGALNGGDELAGAGALGARSRGSGPSGGRGGGGELAGAGVPVAWSREGGSSGGRGGGDDLAGAGAAAARSRGNGSGDRDSGDSVTCDSASFVIGSPVSATPVGSDHTDTSHASGSTGSGDVSTRNAGNRRTGSSAGGFGFGDGGGSGGGGRGGKHGFGSGSINGKGCTSAENTAFEAVTVQGSRYFKVGKIGRGGSSEVCKVLGPDGQMWALKTVTVRGHGEQAETLLDLYWNEIELLRKLQGSPFIIDLLSAELDRNSGVINMLLELGEVDLNKYINQHKVDTAISTRSATSFVGDGCGYTLPSGLDSILVQSIWRSMLHAVHAVHEQRVLHGDLKPANFVLVQGRLKLIDFGIAKAIMDDTVNVYTESQTGTLNYMAPEAFQDMGSGAIDPATGKKKAVMKLGRSSDVWSLGCILYQMAYGQAPFSHVRPMVLKYQAITSPEFVIEFPDLGDESLVETLRGCLTRDPPARPPIPGADGLLAHRYLQPVPSREALRRQKEALDRREAELTKREAFACDCQRRRGPRGIARGDERQASA